MCSNLEKRDQERSLMPLFQIQLEATPEAESICNLDSLLYTKIKLKNTIPQVPSASVIATSFSAILASIAGSQPDVLNVQVSISPVNVHIPPKWKIPVCANFKGPHPASYRGMPKVPQTYYY
ncbi:hypothetical protein CEXT_2211 [Caerostris extrusa]|uniref:Uncharacterized protein n=1 Tax=Caerostris extrusa TaxID=172846 RepID=A0AAV4MK56_CAEEX|nr:hypothetical protein CEXT_2211 [Caerostris extrusa]